jgi:hypothetical protein
MRLNVYRFRLVAFDETRDWCDPPKECRKVFGVYLFHEGEATHCCSLLPSSWCEKIENVFIGLDPEHPFIEEHGFIGLDEDMYTFFIRPEQMPDCVSQAVEFEVDPEDMEAADEEALADAMRDEAWEQAREYFHGNAQSIPVVDREYLEAA